MVGTIEDDAGRTAYQTPYIVSILDQSLEHLRSCVIGSVGESQGLTTT